jgi:hypothetical protein
MILYKKGPRTYCLSHWIMDCYEQPFRQRESDLMKLIYSKITIYGSSYGNS